MSKITGRIDYKINRSKKDAVIPMKPIVWLIRGYGGTHRDGEILLSAELRTEKEIDDSISDLKKNLDDVATRAKNDLRQATEKIRVELFQRGRNREP